MLNYFSVINKQNFCFQQKTDLGPQSPITHPLFSSALPQTEYPGQQFQSQIPTQQSFQPATPISAMHQVIFFKLLCYGKYCQNYF